jgi:hypothetical protein
MNEPGANPLWVSLICVARCLIPLLILLGVSYLVRRLGLVSEPPKSSNGENGNNNPNDGGLAHGRV